MIGFEFESSIQLTMTLSITWLEGAAFHRTVALIGLRLDKLTVPLDGIVQEAGVVPRLKNQENAPAVLSPARDPERQWHHYIAETLRNVLLTEIDQFAYPNTSKERLAPWTRSSQFVLAQRVVITWDLANLPTLILRRGVQFQAHQYPTFNMMISVLSRDYPADFACAI
jgi:hypothetical protein